MHNSPTQCQHSVGETPLLRGGFAVYVDRPRHRSLAPRTPAGTQPHVSDDLWSVLQTTSVAESEVTTLIRSRGFRPPCMSSRYLQAGRDLLLSRSNIFELCIVEKSIRLLALVFTTSTFPTLSCTQSDLLSMCSSESHMLPRLQSLSWGPPGCRIPGSLPTFFMHCFNLKRFLPSALLGHHHRPPHHIPEGQFRHVPLFPDLFTY